MEKAVVRRGIGAVVLALVAALLLGYLLKGKGPERKEVVNMELPKSPIQIFPNGDAGAGANAGDATANAAGAAGAGVAAVGAGAASAAGAAKDGAAKAGGAAVDSGKKLVSLSKDAKKAPANNQPVDAKSGNPSLEKSNVIVDGSGQAIYGAKTAGVKETPANFEFRTPGKKEVRPSIQGRVTAKAKTASKKPAKVAKSNAKLIGEKKLPPVASRSKSGKKGSARKVASSRKKSPASSKGRLAKTRVAKKKVAKSKVAKAKAKVAKRSVAKKTVSKKTVSKKKVATASSGRNKYVVQLLATSNASKANSLKATMSREGYPAYVSRTKRGGKSLYRVRVGSYSGKSTAIKKQASMKRRYRRNSYVQSSVVVRN